MITSGCGTRLGSRSCKPFSHLDTQTLSDNLREGNVHEATVGIGGCARNIVLKMTQRHEQVSAGESWSYGVE